MLELTYDIEEIKEKFEDANSLQDDEFQDNE